MLVSEFDYALPPELIAQHPARAARRAAACCTSTPRGALQRPAVRRPARPGRRRRRAGPERHARDQGAPRRRARASGGEVEIFVERVARPARGAGADPRQPSARAREPSSSSTMSPYAIAARDDDLYRVRFSQDIEARPRALRRACRCRPTSATRRGPRTPSATRPSTPRTPAPSPRRPPACTSTTPLLEEDPASAARSIEKITLHVGAGTFQPVRVDEVEKHRMHKERYAIPPDALERLSRKKGARGRHHAAAGAGNARAHREARRRNRPVRLPRLRVQRGASGCSPTSTCRSRRC